MSAVTLAPLLSLQDTVDTAAVAVGMSDEVRDSMLATMGATVNAPLRTFLAVTPEQVEILVNSITAEFRDPGHAKRFHAVTLQCSVLSLNFLLSACLSPFHHCWGRARCKTCESDWA